MCETGDTRLQVATLAASGDALEGRLELCVNNAWGTVCDSLFSPQDAAVACSRASGFTGQGDVHVMVCVCV